MWALLVNACGLIALYFHVVSTCFNNILSIYPITTWLLVVGVALRLRQTFDAGPAAVPKLAIGGEKLHTTTVIVALWSRLLVFAHHSHVTSLLCVANKKLYQSIDLMTPFACLQQFFYSLLAAGAPPQVPSLSSQTGQTWDCHDYRIANGSSLFQYVLVLLSQPCPLVWHCVVVATIGNYREAISPLCLAWPWGLCHLGGLRLKGLTDVSKSGTFQSAQKFSRETCQLEKKEDCYQWDSMSNDSPQASICWFRLTDR